MLELDSKVIQGGLYPKNLCSAAMYSASTVESATLFCFFDDQETSDLPNS
jgi:hypothetical protein